MLLRAEDYAELSKTFQGNFNLAKSTIDFPKQELPLDPYFFGLLLGDRSFRESQIEFTTPDAEVIEYLYKIDESNQWPVKINKLKNNLSDHYYFKKSLDGIGSLKQIIASLGLYNHKSDIKSTMFFICFLVPLFAFFSGVRRGIYG
ncbi:hypothetical protein AGMMS49949_03500 [Alphaproteobacteria bacterium]|nr:hypothetical protein AGMMS49949_03500 [Alphaproteobacteria bacterium]GHS96764.1 hypothetical protein AGMMS50296_3200 [Alphaproteobacteria bacterium]